MNIPAFAACFLFSITTTTMSQTAPVSASFGHLKDGRAVTICTLTNSGGVEVRVMNYGAAIVSWKAPDRDGKQADIVLGFDTLREYEGGHPFFGVIAGRYANRIAKGKFSLDGKEHTLPVNNGPNSLHGGIHGFDKKLWAVKTAGLRDGVPTLVLTYSSADGEEGYPGKLDCEVSYSLNEKNELKLDYRAVTDKPTVVNLTNHSYFNLAGQGSGPVIDHVALLHCSRYTPTDKDLIPTGAVADVAGTPLDFRTPARIGARIEERSFEPIAFGGGYDHNLIIDGDAGTLRPAALITEPVSGRTLECLTTEPAVQLYTANGMSAQKGKAGRTYGKYGGFCLETQHYPDSPNHPAFPTTVLRPGAEYRHTCVYRTGIAK